jgi:hypothetical protein
MYIIGITKRGAGPAWTGACPALWCATTGDHGDHVGFESWLEREHVIMLDFDPVIVGLVMDVRAGVPILDHRAAPASRSRDDR